MDRRFSAIVGVALIVVGGLALLFSLGMPVLGVRLSPFWPVGLAWRWLSWLWPLVVVGLGLLFVVPPLLTRGRPGLGALLIPGMPILTTGAILLLANLFRWWDVWSWLWPQEVLALALGFLFAAIYTHKSWLAVPAIIVGLNGLVFQFCAVTGLWEAWAVLWTIEPLSVGLALLLVGVKTRKVGLTAVGLVFCALAGLGLIIMTLVLSDWWLLNTLGAVAIILVGCSLLVWSLVHRPSSASAA